MNVVDVESDVEIKGEFCSRLYSCCAAFDAPIEYLSCPVQKGSSHKLPRIQDRRS